MPLPLILQVSAQTPPFLSEAIFEYPLQGATHTCTPHPSLYFPIAFIPAFLLTASMVASMKAGTLPYGLAVSPAPAVCGTWWKLNK